MQSDFEIDPTLDEPLERGRHEEDEPDRELELMRAAESEFREVVSLPGDLRS